MWKGKEYRVVNVNYKMSHTFIITLDNKIIDRNNNKKNNMRITYLVLEWSKLPVVKWIWTRGNYPFWLHSCSVSDHLRGVAPQENSGILTDIPTKNEILGISREISSEYTDGISRKYKSVGIFLWNTDEKRIPRKKPMNSEDIL